MKISASLFFTDILPHRRTWYHKIVKSKLFDKHSTAEVFRKLQQSGVEGIELLLPSFTPVTDHHIHEVKGVLNKYHMPVFSIHQKLRFFTKTKIAEITHLFHIADFLGAKVIVLHMNNAGKQFFDTNYTTLLHSLEKKYGISVGFENMEKHPASLFFPHRWHHEIFSRLIDEKDFNITFDTTHLAHSGGNILTFFKKNKKRIVNIHLSDYRPHLLNSTLRPMRFKHLSLGNGVLPMQDFLRLLKDEKYQGLVTMEIHTDLAGMCENAEIISGIVKK